MRSVELGDLSDVDLRRGLIEHFSQSTVLQELRGDNPIGLWKSGLQREVFTKLTARGSGVIPQVKLGGFVVDMVLEGAADRRVAIELDGDEVRGPDCWAHDMSRHRISEHAGWTSWRCLASTWSLYKDEVLAELLSRLHQMHVAPIGALGQLATLVERRICEPRTKRMGEAEDEADLVIQQAIDDARTDST